MILKSTKFKDLKIITSPVYKDSRGFFRETLRKNLLLKKKFPFTCVSSSKKMSLEDYICKQSFLKENI